MAVQRNDPWGKFTSTISNASSTARNAAKNMVSRMGTEFNNFAQQRSTPTTNTNFSPTVPSVPSAPTTQQQQSYSNPYANEYRSILEAAKSRLMQPRTSFSYDPDRDSAFQAAASTARQNAQTAQANTNARLRATGQGRSSYSEAVANQIAQQAEQNIMNSIRPQYEQMAYDRFVNDQNLERQNLNDLLNLGSQYNQLGQQDFSNRLAQSAEERAMAQLTGRMQLPEVAQRYINEVLDLKRQAEGPGVTTEQMNQYRNQADGLRQQLAMMGVDPNIVGYESDYGQALQNVARGTPTLAARQFDYDVARDQRNFETDVYRDQRNYETDVARDARNFEYQTLRDQIEDERYKQKFDEDVRRFGLQFAADEAYRQGQLALQRRGQDISASNAAASNSLARERFEFEKQQASNPKPSSSQSKNDFEADVIINLDQMDPNMRKRVLESEKATIIRELGKSGYDRIYGTYFDEDGEPR